MNRPYLIQRMRITDATGSFDDTLNLDYMGSAEFEFGALPASLKRITKKCNNLKVNSFKKIKKYNGQSLCIVATELDAKEYFEQYIKDLVNNNIKLKEVSRLKDEINGCGSEYLRVDAWWDIENDVIFVFGKKNAKRIQKTIQNTRDKKAKEKGWY